MSTLTGKSSSASKDSAKKVARNYVERGWSPIPVPYGEKAPNKAGWQKLRISKMAVDTHFGERRMNVGVLLARIIHSGPGNRLASVA